MSLLTILRSPPNTGAGDVSLQAIAASCVFDLDATMEASYGGSGTTWSNLVATPADGSAQTAYNFTFGDGANSATYPTFNGTAGDSAAYFSFDGGDYFTCAETITAFTENVSKTTGGQPFTAVMCYQVFDSGVDQTILANGGNSAGSEIGYRFGQNRAGTTRAFLRFAGASSATNALLPNSTADPSVGDNVLQYCAKDATTNYKLGIAGGEVTGTTVAGGTSYANWIIGARPDGFPVSSGFRIYSIAVFNEVLDADQLAAVKAALGARHGRTYL